MTAGEDEPVAPAQGIRRGCIAGASSTAGNASGASPIGVPGCPTSPSGRSPTGTDVLIGPQRERVVPHRWPPLLSFAWIHFIIGRFSRRTPAGRFAAGCRRPAVLPTSFPPPTAIAGSRHGKASSETRQEGDLGRNVQPMPPRTSSRHEDQARPSPTIRNRKRS